MFVGFFRSMFFFFFFFFFFFVVVGLLYPVLALFSYLPAGLLLLHCLSACWLVVQKQSTTKQKRGVFR